MSFLFKKARINKVILCLVFFSVVYFCLHGLPLSLDDNSFQARSFPDFQHFLSFLLAFGNGRLLGNGGVIVLLHHPLLGDLVRAATITGIALLLPSVLKRDGFLTTVLSMLLMLVISPGVFGQAYSWMSGFQNYVPPVFFFLLGVWFLQHYDGKSTPVKLLLAVAVFLCGLCMQLYIEHSACINFLLAICLLVYALRRGRLPVLPSVLFLAGASLGMLLMFLPPFLIASDLHGGVSSYLSSGLSGLVYGVSRNAVFLLGMYTENAVALLLLAVLQCLLLRREKALFSARSYSLLIAGLLFPAAAFLFNLAGGIQSFYGKLAIHESAFLVAAFFLFLFCMLFSGIRILKHRKDPCLFQTAIMLCMAIVSIAPLLLVWPTGYRCLFHSYVFLSAAVILLADELLFSAPVLSKSKMSAALLTALCVVLLGEAALFADIRRMVAIREEYVQQLVAERKTSGEYFYIPSLYVHDFKDQPKRSHTYGDLTISFDIIPADIWFRKNYYHYT